MMAKPREVVVTLEPPIDDCVREEVRQGLFGSPGEFIEAVLCEHIEDEKACSELERQLKKGLDDVDAGRVMSIDEAFDAAYVELALKPRAG